MFQHYWNFFITFFEMKFPQKQHELTNCFFIIIILALLHFTDGKKTLLHQSFFQWILLLSQVEACLKIFQMEDLLCNIGGGEAIQGQILIQAGLCKYTELQPVKMRPFQCILRSWKRGAPSKKGQKRWDVCMCMCTHICVWTQPFCYCSWHSRKAF